MHTATPEYIYIYTCISSKRHARHTHFDRAFAAESKWLACRVHNARCIDGSEWSARPRVERDVGGGEKEGGLGKIK